MSEATLKVRVIAPDQWLESKMEFAPDTPLEQLKRQALPELLKRSDFDPQAYYVEYFEKEVLDESLTLADLGVPPNGVIAIRKFDIDHPPPFTG